jgi:hypothetical protein
MFISGGPPLLSAELMHRTQWKSSLNFIAVFADKSLIRYRKTEQISVLQKRDTFCIFTVKSRANRSILKNVDQFISMN